MKPVPGICDRCGQRYHLHDLQEEDILGAKTGKLVCRSCYDPSHPQLDTRHVRTDDKQSVKDPRTDRAERVYGRALSGYDPYVGIQATSTLTLSLGRVRTT